MVLLQRSAQPAGPGTRPAAGLAAATLALALVAAPSPAGGQQAGAQLRAEVPARVIVTVADLETEVGLANVLVRLQRSEGPAAAAQITNEAGRIVYARLEPGRYQIDISHLGYRTLRDSLVLEAGSDVRLNAALAPIALQLEPLLVVFANRGPASLGGFYERRRAGLGWYITREEIETRAPAYITDVLRSVPGLRITQTARGVNTVTRGGCQPDLYIDGIRVAAAGGFGIDQLLPVSDVEGVEVYRSLQAPPQFQHGTCGAVVVWTRIGEGGEGGSFWKRLAFAAGLVAAGFFLLR